MAKTEPLSFFCEIGWAFRTHVDNKDVRKRRNISVSWNEENYGSRKDLENGCWLEFRFLSKYNCWKKKSAPL